MKFFGKGDDEANPNATLGQRLTDALKAMSEKNAQELSAFVVSLVYEFKSGNAKRVVICWDRENLPDGVRKVMPYHPAWTVFVPLGQRQPPWTKKWKTEIKLSDGSRFLATPDD